MSEEEFILIVVGIVCTIIGIIIGYAGNRAVHARLTRLEDLVMSLGAARRGFDHKQQHSERETAIEEKPSPEEDSQSDNPWWVWVLVIPVAAWMALEYVLWKPTVFIWRKLFRRAD